MTQLNFLTSQSILDKRDTLVQAIVERQYGLQPGTWQAFGATGRQKSLRDAGYHLAYLIEAIAGDAPAVLATWFIRPVFGKIRQDFRQRKRTLPLF